MTLEEAKILADNGNANAMMALVEYYSNVLAKDKDNEAASDMLSEYLERAAEAGHPEAILKMAESSYMSASIFIKMISSHGQDKSWKESLESAHKWALRLIHLLQPLQGNEKAKQLANDRFIDIIVWLSTIYWCDENWDGVLRITENVSSPVAQALRGYALYELSETNDEMEHAFSFLKNALHPDFLSDKYSTPTLVEAMRLETCVILSCIYRVVYKDLDSAYNVLSTILQHTKDAKFRQSIQEDLSRYRKTLFGGYKYID